MAAMSLPAADVRLVIFGTMLAMFVAALDQTIVATALPTIAGELGDAALLSWVVTAYLVSSTAATPIAGQLSDLYGRRPAVRAAILVFVGASALCALAPSMPVLIAAHALQGVGGGALLVLAQTVVADVVSPRERGRYAAYFAGVWALASLLGPTLGGLLAEGPGWPWIFWINLPLGALALAATEPVLRRLPARAAARGALDLPSVILLPLATVALLLALSFGGATFPWLSAPILGALALAALAAWAFARRQGRIADPVLPPSFLADDVVGRALPAIFLVFGSFLALSVTAPVFLDVALGFSPSRIGLTMIGFSVPAAAAAFVTGRWVRTHGDYRRPPLVGLPLAVAALALLALAARDPDPAVVAGLLTLAGLGTGTIFPTTIVAVQNAVAPHQVGAVTGALGYARSIGGAVITAGATALVLGLLGDGSRSLDALLRGSPDEAGRAAAGAAFAWLFAAFAGLYALGWASFARVAARTLRERPASAAD
jgi:EmrB/QacA subfamily drug resistance transporter